MTLARLAEFGLNEATLTEIRSAEERRARVFKRLLLVLCGLLWAALTAALYGRWGRGGPLLGLLGAALFAAMGAALGALPLGLLAAAASWLAAPPHPKAADLDRYEAARSQRRVCEVCALVRGNETPRHDVAFCARCNAWLCESCRRRYDLRALAALRRLL